MNPSKWLQTATFTTKVTHSIRLAPFSLGAVNSGIGDESNDEQIKYFSVIGLCKYVEVLLQHDVEFVGSNLSTIIVSLFPILYGDNDDDEFEVFFSDDAAANLRQSTISLAVNFLTSLTTGKIGEELLPFFSQIPFLPETSKLDSVRAGLKAGGVDLDELTQKRCVSEP